MVNFCLLSIVSSDKLNYVVFLVSSMFNSLSSVVTALFFCFISLWLLYPLAIKIRLVDCPNERKTHLGEIPLIGGLAMYVGFVIALLTSTSDLNKASGILIASTIIISLGMLDDHREISVRIRMIIQIISILIMILFSGVALNDLGNIFNTGLLQLSWWAIPFTIFASVGIINAMNLIDGVDGLAGSTAIICFLSISILYFLAGDYDLKPILYIGVLIPFLFRNLCSAKKVFMGDAGSMFLGLGIVWVIIMAHRKWI